MGLLSDLGHTDAICLSNLSLFLIDQSLTIPLRRMRHLLVIDQIMQMGHVQIWGQENYIAKRYDNNWLDGCLSIKIFATYSFKSLLHPYGLIHYPKLLAISIVVGATKLSVWRVGVTKIVILEVDHAGTEGLLQCSIFLLFKFNMYYKR